MKVNFPWDGGGSARTKWSFLMNNTSTCRTTYTTFFLWAFPLFLPRLHRMIYDYRQTLCFVVIIVFNQATLFPPPPLLSLSLCFACVIGCNRIGSKRSIGWNRFPGTPINILFILPASIYIIRGILRVLCECKWLFVVARGVTVCVCVCVCAYEISLFIQNNSSNTMCRVSYCRFD